MDVFSPEELDRYARQIILKEIGGAGQQALTRSHVLIIGAGGLSSPAALYLAASGVGNITIADDDVVSISNLQRQILFSTGDAGESKTATAATRLSALNPEIEIHALEQRMDAVTLAVAVTGKTLVLDGSDNYETRFAVNAACHAASIPLVSGAVERFSGQVAVFDFSAGTPCYRCLTPEIPPDAETCAQIGVAGPAAGVIGAWMALEAIKLITGAGEPLIGRLALFDGLQGQSRVTNLPRDPACPLCS